jgi:hypothetical protein
MVKRGVHETAWMDHCLAELADGRRIKTKNSAAVPYCERPFPAAQAMTRRLVGVASWSQVRRQRWVSPRSPPLHRSRPGRSSSLLAWMPDRLAHLIPGEGRRIGSLAATAVLVVILAQETYTLRKIFRMLYHPSTWVDGRGRERTYPLYAYDRPWRLHTEALAWLRHQATPGEIIATSTAPLGLPQDRTEIGPAAVGAGPADRGAAAGDGASGLPDHRQPECF